MLTTLVFWALAMYGAWSILTKCILHLQQKKTYSNNQESYIFIVQDLESSIEGILRLGMIRTAFRKQRRQIVVIDFHSVDQTANIVKRLMTIHTCISYRLVTSQEDLMVLLAELCLDQRGFAYVYDLRDRDVLNRATHGIVWQLPEKSAEKNNN